MPHTHFDNKSGHLHPLKGICTQPDHCLAEFQQSEDSQNEFSLVNWRMGVKGSRGGSPKALKLTKSNTASFA